MPLSHRFVRWQASACLSLLLLLLACSAPGDGSPEAVAAGAEPWSVTAWGELYELFPEVEPLVAGEPARAHVHVTVLDGFSPLSEGRVAIVLRDRGPGGSADQTFEQTEASRPGIFPVEIVPARAGEFDLLFRVDSGAGREEIVAGRVRVGTREAPGGLVTGGDEPGGGQEIPFLKEQQWKTPFATAAAVAGRLAPAAVVPATVVTRPGGDLLLSAPAGGRLAAEPWPFAGRAIAKGEAVFHLVPRLDEDVSLAEREAEVDALAAELQTVTRQAARHRALADSGMVAVFEAEQSEGEQRALSARMEAARRDLETVRNARGGAADAGERVEIRAPFDGVVAAVEVTAGQGVEAGETLGRFVANNRWWLEVALPTRLADGLVPGPIELAVRSGGTILAMPAPPAPPDATARLVAVAPAVDPGSGRVMALVELPPGAGPLRAGQAVEVEMASGPERDGVLLPVDAVLDDAGVPVVYLQRSGEGFERREVRVEARRGRSVLVGGVAVGERVVTLGAAAIRRAALAGAGVGEGHVH